MPSVVTTMKMGGTSAVLSRSYNTIHAPQVVRVSALQITKELLRTKGIVGLYRGLGATLMRLKAVLIFSFLIIFNVSNVVIVYLVFQGHPILCFVLPSFCTSAPAGSAFV